MEATSNLSAKEAVSWDMAQLESRYRHSCDHSRWCCQVAGALNQLVVVQFQLVVVQFQAISIRDLVVAQRNMVLVHCTTIKAGGHVPGVSGRPSAGARWLRTLAHPPVYHFWMRIFSGRVPAAPGAHLSLWVPAANEQSCHGGSSLRASHAA